MEGLLNYFLHLFLELTLIELAIEKFNKQGVS